MQKKEDVYIYAFEIISYFSHAYKNASYKELYSKLSKEPSALCVFLLQDRKKMITSSMTTKRVKTII